MTCSLLYHMTQILFDEGLPGSFCLEPFWWHGAATVQWGQSLFEVAVLSSFTNMASSGGHFTPPFVADMEHNWNDMFMAVLRDTNSL